MRFVLVVALCCLGAVFASGASAKKTLVVVEDMGQRDSHSLLLSTLSARGHELVFKLAEDPTLSLNQYGEWLYDNVVIFAPTTDGMGEGLELKAVTEFVDSGRNLLIFSGPEASESVRTMAAEFGLELDEDKKAVVDHANADESYPAHSAIKVSGVTQNRAIVGSKKLKPILYSGAAMTMVDNNPLVVPLAWGSDSTVSTAPGGTTTIAGPQALLVGAMQARNNARVVVTGSTDVCGNEFSTLSKYGNAEFCAAVAEWAVGDRGILRAKDVTYGVVGGTERPSAFRIKDDVQYSVVIEEYSGSTGKWVPFKADDVQIEFRMLDPYIRQALTSDSKGKYSIRFQVPDVYGIFKFQLKYVREGWSYLEVNTQVPVHPFRHNEYERFIVAAYPYYASAFSMMAAFLLFGLVFLHSRTVRADKEKSM